MRGFGIVLILTAVLPPTLSAMLGVGAAGFSDDTGAGVAEKSLPGSRVGIREAARDARLVVVVTDVAMGQVGDPQFIGQAPYPNVTMRVVKSLKGEASKNLSSVRVVVRTFPDGSTETLPEKDKEYVFFLKGSAPDALSSIKVLRATKENIRSAEEALKAVDP